MRRRLQFWVIALPWWLWWVTAAFTWLACHTVGHVPMQNWNPKYLAYWHCTWCLKDVPAPVKSSTEEQAGGRHG